MIVSDENNLGLLKEEEVNMQTKVSIKCLCGKEVILKVEGGQYPNTYNGDCECGRKWTLTELTEILAEIEDC